jgi:hypothetical protein
VLEECCTDRSPRVQEFWPSSCTVCFHAPWKWRSTPQAFMASLPCQTVVQL